MNFANNFLQISIQIEGECKNIRSKNWTLAWELRRRRRKKSLQMIFWSRNSVRTLKVDIKEKCLILQQQRKKKKETVKQLFRLSCWRWWSIKEIQQHSATTRERERDLSELVKLRLCTTHNQVLAKKEWRKREKGVRKYDLFE